ncbi:MAG TPA: hypothetical protein VG982_00370 [Candidatus Paceibacterota bacterium]|nr:hypothetical protein [Candidatus Paceibacterota bacterium]
MNTSRLLATALWSIATIGVVLVACNIIFLMSSVLLFVGIGMIITAIIVAVAKKPDLID